MTLTLGTTLGPYSVTAKIGEGGMGEVYRARDRKLDRDVALIGDFRHRLRRIGELGAIFITVAIALLGLLVFSSFTIDHGLRMVACGQSKTAADAGALAAALYLAWDDPSGSCRCPGEPGGGGQAPDVQPSDVTFPPCPPGAPGPVDTSVQVDVYRNQERGNAQ